MPSQLAAHKVVAGIVGSSALLLSSIPGISLLAHGTWAPPGQESLYASVVSVVGALTLILLPLYRREIGAMQRGRVVRLTTGIAIGGFLALGAYGYLSHRALFPSSGHVIHVPSIRTEALAVYENGDGLPAEIEKQPDAIELEARSAPGRLLLDDGAFLLLYIIIEVSVVSSLTIAAWRLACEPEERNRSPDISINDESAKNAVTQPGV